METLSSFRTGSGRRSGQRFDAEHGVVTEALIFLGELDPEAMGEALEDATHYEPTPVAQCNAMLDAVPTPLETFSFVDVGAGMGRIVLLASRRPFKQITGVEFSPALCEVAQDNVVRWRRGGSGVACKDLRIVCRDALDFRFPPGDLAVYLYNPFGAASVQRLADTMAGRNDGACYVLYHTPVHRAIFDADAHFKRVAELPFGVVYRKV